jgi:Protein of unknown function (DUF3500)
MTHADPAGRMADAARAWLDSLDDEQRAAARLPWPAEQERHRWYYTPTDHGGLPLARMRPAQQQLAMRLVASGLSLAGYVTASTIMGLENVLDRVEGWVADWGRERGRDPQMYWLRVFGDPGSDGPWSWRFGGHHVSVQHVVIDGQVRASTPCFLGADPAQAPLLGPHLLRPLGAAEDLARDLVHSLDEQQAARALLSPVAPTDIAGGNRPRIGDGDRPMRLPDIWRGHFTDPRLAELAESIQRKEEEKGGVRAEHVEAVRLTTAPRGVPAAALSPGQRDQLRAVLDIFIGRIPEDLAEREAAKFAGDKLHDVHFAWAGGIERRQPHYYRLQGPRLLAEYDNTQHDVNHVHTVWRDPEGDFGDDILARHLAAGHQGLSRAVQVVQHGDGDRAIGQMRHQVADPRLGGPGPRVGHSQHGHRCGAGRHGAGGRAQAADRDPRLRAGRPQHPQHDAGAHAGQQPGERAEPGNPVGPGLFVAGHRHPGGLGKLVHGFLGGAAGRSATQRHVQVGHGVERGRAGRAGGCSGQQAPGQTAHDVIPRQAAGAAGRAVRSYPARPRLCIVTAGREVSVTSNVAGHRTGEMNVCCHR